MIIKRGEREPVKIPIARGPVGQLVMEVTFQKKFERRIVQRALLELGSGFGGCDWARFKTRAAGQRNSTTNDEYTFHGEAGGAPASGRRTVTVVCCNGTDSILI